MGWSLPAGGRRIGRPLHRARVAPTQAGCPHPRLLARMMDCFAQGAMRRMSFR